MTWVGSFLCLAALYESWVIPFLVMLVVFGALVAKMLRGLNNDVFFVVVRNRLV
ncbi:efflux RND transporter permease subunit [Erwinia pyrifoliae]|nr:efflux RND transporter permease subunit [Erwinia pyrifoliae]